MIDKVKAIISYRKLKTYLLVLFAAILIIRELGLLNIVEELLRHLITFSVAICVIVFCVELLWTQYRKRLVI